ncbi:glutathione S-transferase family protein [Sneathiella limimaris]|uniref:glutathione S-transferase family protein n=1 Tax=Sneathiella limimaris TaxID=1964213 RepID=UPI00146B08ED|nr:glutathione S-transferase family protein [Sneathiella limimaris]
MTYELISHSLCPYVQRAAIVLEEKKIPFVRRYVDLSNKPQWFLKLSPLGKVPLLLVDDQVLFESQVIADYLDEVTPESLYPSDPLEKARHKSWIEFGSATLNAIGGFYSAPDQQSFEDKRTALHKRFLQIDQQIKGPFFGGGSFQLIDGVWATIFRYLDVFEEIGDFHLMEGANRVSNWRNVVANRSSVKSAVSPEYPQLLRKFLENKNSYISTLIPA